MVATARHRPSSLVDKKFRRRAVGRTSGTMQQVDCCQRPVIQRTSAALRKATENDRHDFWAKAAAWQGRRQLFSTAMHAVRILERMKLTFPDRNGFVGHLRLRGAFCGASGSSRNPPGLEIAESADFCWPTGLTAQGISTDTSLPRCARVSIGQRLLRSLCGGSWGGRGRAW